MTTSEKMPSLMGICSVMLGQSRSWHAYSTRKVCHVQQVSFIRTVTLRTQHLLGAFCPSKDGVCAFAHLHEAALHCFHFALLPHPLHLQVSGWIVMHDEVTIAHLASIEEIPD